MATPEEMDGTLAVIGRLGNVIQQLEQIVKQQAGIISEQSALLEEQQALIDQSSAAEEAAPSTVPLRLVDHEDEKADEE